jgi:hypothetical protein
MKILQAIKSFFIELNRVSTYNIAYEALERIKNYKEIMANGTPEEKKAARLKKRVETKTRLKCYRNMSA